MAERFDVVIVGGAVTGSVLALALNSFTQHKIRIALVEKSLPNHAEQGGFDARSIALAEGSLQKMAKIVPLVGNNLGELARQIGTPIQQIHVSDQGHFGKTTLTARELGLAQFGVVVPLAELGRDLMQRIAQQSNITLFCPNTVSEIERTVSQATLTLDNGQQLHCALIVAADGIQSQIAQRSGVQTLLLKDYAQTAVIANVEISEPHQSQAFERFTAQGPLALLPLSEQRMSLVWCVKNAETLLSLTEAEFLAKLQQQFGWRLGQFKRVGKRFAYPLSSQKAESHIHHRLAIVGNAAQLLHPVAGQGFNLGLRDLFELATRLSCAFQLGKDLGDYHLLMAFDQQRKSDQNQIIRITSGLVSLFSCELLPIQILRNTGLTLLAHNQHGREWFVQKVLG